LTFLGPDRKERLMGNVTIISMPAEHAGPVDAWLRGWAYRELLRGGLDNLGDELRALSDVESPLDRLTACVERVQWYTDQLERIAGEGDLSATGRRVAGRRAALKAVN
jgi:hypothetical protein